MGVFVTSTKSYKQYIKLLSYDNLLSLPEDCVHEHVDYFHV